MEKHPAPPPKRRLAGLTLLIVAGLFLGIYGIGRILNGTIFGNATAGTTALAAKPNLPIATMEEPFDLATYLADPVKGAQVAARCQACHTFEPGGADRTGPNLFGIVGAPVEHKPGFPYSTALSRYKATHPNWTGENLDAYLKDPRGTVPGTRMIFPGITDARERADLIAWLKTLK